MVEIGLAGVVASEWHFVRWMEFMAFSVKVQGRLPKLHGMLWSWALIGLGCIRWQSLLSYHDIMQKRSSSSR